MLYHMVINTDKISYENAARLMVMRSSAAANWRARRPQGQLSQFPF